MDLREMFIPTKQKIMAAILLTLLVPAGIYSILSILKTNPAAGAVGLAILFFAPVLLFVSSSTDTVMLFAIISILDLAFWYFVASIGVHIIKINKKSDSK